MKLQSFIIIFVVIALPVIIILSVYVNYQVKTVNLQAQYDSFFLGATYDMLQAFQLNTTNDKYAGVSDTLVRDIEASINVFTTSLASAFGVAGQSKAEAMVYVPAIVYSLYDGYYIYTPTMTFKEMADGTVETPIENNLKPYVYYTKEYEGRSGTKVQKLIINYSLDNYIAVYYYDENGKYNSKAGYLELIARDTNSDHVPDTDGVFMYNDNVYYNKQLIPKTETIEKRVYRKVGNNSYEIQDYQNESDSAYEYYKNAYEFTTWFNNLIDSPDIKENGQPIKNKLQITTDNSALPNVASKFNDEKFAVIENSITSNLMQTLETYKQKVGGSYEFTLPRMSIEDWDKILNNVCVITFLQGLNVGTAKYNNYVVMPSTENEQYINDSGIYYIGYKSIPNTAADYNLIENGIKYLSNGTYHRIGCPQLKGDKIVGYNRREFKRQPWLDDNGDNITNINGMNKYYYNHWESACYYCIVHSTDSSLDKLEETYSGTLTVAQRAEKNRKLIAYYTARAREKKDLTKLSSYINGSAEQRKEITITLHKFTGANANEILGRGTGEPLSAKNAAGDLLNPLCNDIINIKKYSYLPNVIIPRRRGHIFKGYYAGPNGTGTQYINENGKAIFTGTIANNLDLNAFWD